MSEFVIFTEDSSKTASETLEVIVKLIFENIGFCDFILNEPNLTLKPLLRANYWKSRKLIGESTKNEKNSKPFDRQTISDFKKALVNELIKSDHYIIWHFDGDCKFSDYDSVSCDKRLSLQKLLDDLPNVVLTRKGIEKRVSKDEIIFMVPCYSIESWLFQSKTVIRDMLNGLSNQKALAPEVAQEKFLVSIRKLNKLLALKVDTFDEIVQIKDYFIKSNLSKASPELAKGIPYDTMMEIEKSFYCFVNNLKRILASGPSDEVKEIVESILK